jgi:hypothetical protein
MPMKKIYVAGPYTKGDVAINVRNAFQVANILAERGFAPYVPHSTHFWHLIFPHDYEFWLNLDREFIPCCDAILRIHGDSNGADKEVKYATELGLPIFFDVDTLTNTLKP